METISATRSESRSPSTAASRWKTAAGWVTIVTIACSAPTYSFWRTELMDTSLTAKAPARAAREPGLSPTRSWSR